METDHGGNIYGSTICPGICHFILWLFKSFDISFCLDQAKQKYTILVGWKNKPLQSSIIPLKIPALSF
jgi:hypothetical protein